MNTNNFNWVCLYCHLSPILRRKCSGFQGAWWLCKRYCMWWWSLIRNSQAWIEYIQQIQENSSIAFLFRPFRISCLHCLPKLEPVAIIKKINKNKVTQLSYWFEWSQSVGAAVVQELRAQAKQHRVIRQKRWTCLNVCQNAMLWGMAANQICWTYICGILLCNMNAVFQGPQSGGPQTKSRLQKAC